MDDLEAEKVKAEEEAKERKEAIERKKFEGMCFLSASFLSGVFANAYLITLV